VLDFQSSLKSSWLVAASGARVRVGFAPPVGRERSHLFHNSRVRVPRRGIHRIERALALLTPLGITPQYVDAVLPCVEEQVRAAEAAWAGVARPRVVIHPGTSRFGEFKRWMPERFAELAARLVQERQADVLVTWGPGECELAQYVASKAGEGVKLAPELAHLQQLVGVLRQAELFIGSDTGPMHVASALKVPVVALFGPKDEVQTGPYSTRSEVVTAPVGCRPCTRRRCEDPQCMGHISVAQVFEAACRLLDGGGEVRASRGLHGPSEGR